MPPISCASISPPNIVPLTATPSASIEMIGNLPCGSSDGWILMPSIEPENVSPPMPLIPVTLAERVRTKSSGWLSMSAHSIPIASIRTPRNDGIPKPSPVAEPTPRKTPKPGLVLNVPSPSEREVARLAAQLEAPILTFAPTDWNETSPRSRPAPVLRKKSRAVSVTKLESLISSVSTLNLNASTSPPAKTSSSRIASSFGEPSGLLSSAVWRSVIVAEIVLPGKNFAPPEAT